MILLATATKSGTVAWNLALLVSVTTGFIYTFYAQYTNLSVKQLGDRFPNLVFHAPTHHQTQLGSILGDLLSAHLDPDLELEWNKWKTKFNQSLMPGNDEKQALERLLYVYICTTLERYPTQMSQMNSHHSWLRVNLKTFYMSKIVISTGEHYND